VVTQLPTSTTSAPVAAQSNHFFKSWSSIRWRFPMEIVDGPSPEAISRRIVSTETPTRDAAAGIDSRGPALTSHRQLQGPIAYISMTGVCQPSVFRGLALRAAATAAMCING